MNNENLAEALGIKHVGIIMDGNGRWAKKRLLPRMAGHTQGVKAFKNCLNSCVKLGIPCVTFYAFSTENWSRPKEEVDSLMKLFCSFMDEMIKLDSQNIRIRFLGSREGLSKEVLEKMETAENMYANNTGMWCCIAFNYGGREEILQGVKKAAIEYKSGGMDLCDLNEEKFSSLLYTRDLPDVDLVIRPSGEKRLSNFLIWQTSYAEFVFMDVLWPDFNERHLIDALTEYGKRNRRFGGV
ncbi:MAG: polyprenyl diphosphate synthase [[Eubacterium] siraeum]|nr:polyprenyl diphosphate synthase [[Eubacterium] siraeum]